MMQKQSREQLGVKPGDEIFIEGKVHFARVAQAIDGEDLANENKRRAGIGLSPMDKAFRTITISDPKVIQGQGTPLAQFHESKIYQPKGDANARHMSFESKSKIEPKFYCLNANGEITELKNPGKNPAVGQTVVLRVRAYGGKTATSRLGSTFEDIAYMSRAEDIQFYTGGNSAQSLEGFAKATNRPVSNDVQTAPGAAAPAQPAPAEGFGGFQGAQQSAPAEGFGLDPNGGGNSAPAPNTNPSPFS